MQNFATYSEGMFVVFLYGIRNALDLLVFLLFFFLQKLQITHIIAAVGAPS